MTIYSNIANAGADTVNIISSIPGSMVLFLSKAYPLVILNNPGISSSVSIFVP